MLSVISMVYEMGTWSVMYIDNTSIRHVTGTGGLIGSLRLQGRL